MIYSVHFYYRKVGSRKAAGKFEGIVFAKDQNHAEELVRKMISDYPIKPEEHFSIIGGSDKTLEEIYNERPELNGITPERGYIYNEFMHRNYISRTSHRSGNLKRPV
ncbi:hypothetical protein SAMN05660649_04603 [Desulfotomaculum arcticum]|uniref:Uncharacterized protein n=1 Tax=Desulfotruncus arcticus DSM 17038 TaxID=1121424 RepID=A0A1I2YWV4_9FIRM|nr:hypothetical protein [Desulfotruncus arcticus]SFH29141.1 hypothetical protein SAMN05660649_04603 [Desulfotomaculum arcticum] [Desulfotruncus arcticus DSM 17038]